MDELVPERKAVDIKDVPKSRIPIPSSLYVEGGRSAYLDDLAGQVYREDVEEPAEVRRGGLRRRRRGDSFSEEEPFDYGPPGILHTGPGRKERRLRRRDSEFGDSSIELLGPSTSLETDESDGTGDLLSESLEYDEDGVRIGDPDEDDEFDSEKEKGERRAGSAVAFKRYSVKKPPIKKSKTVAGDEDVPRDVERKERQKDRDIDGDGRMEGPQKKKQIQRYEEKGDFTREEPGRGRPPPRRSDRGRGEGGPGPSAGITGARKKQTKQPPTTKKPGTSWQRQPGRPLSSGPSRTPSKSPVGREDVGLDGRVEKQDGFKEKGGKSPKRYPEKTPKGLPDKLPRGLPDKSPKGILDKSPKRIPDKSPKRLPDKSIKRFPDKSPKRFPEKASPIRFPEKKDQHREPSAVDKVEAWRKDAEKNLPRGPDDKDKWRVSPVHDKGKKKEEFEDFDEMKSKKPAGVEWDPQEAYEEGDELKKIMASKPPKPAVLNTKGMDPAKLAEKLKEDDVRDTAAGIRLLQLCQSGDWYGVDGHLRYFEKRVASGLAINRTPLKGLKDEGTGWTPLMYAIKDNRITIADRMIELGCEVNAVAKDGFYAIHLAALHGRDDTIRFMLYKKCDVTVLTEGKKQNVLHLATSRQTGNSASILRALLAAAPKECRMQKDVDGNVPLTLALKNGLKGACQELLTHMAEEQLNVTSGGTVESPLHVAIRRKDLEICRLLVDAGADVNLVNKDGQTPLHLAAEMGDENAAKFLYLCKANPNIADKDDRTPIHLAAMNGHTQLIDLLADKFKVSVFERTKDGSTLMHIASLHGHPETAMALFRKGVPLQMPNKGGARSIHIAARHGHAAMISKLLEKGEKVDAVTNDNFTALHIAVDAVKPNVVETLLGYGADVHIKGGKDKETPLHIAARVTGGEKCALMLLKSGANPNITMENGETPLHIAAHHGRLKMIQLLLANGADSQQRTSEGLTPLHEACKWGHYRVVQVLLEHVKRTKSANELTLFINMVTTKGESALHYAAKLNTKKIVLQASEADLKKEEIGRDIVKLLLDGGSSVSRLTKETNETAFHFCCREGNNEILKEMLSRLSHVECMRALNRQSTKGWSPLLIASRRGHTDVVQTLLEYHARVDVFDTEGRSGLHLAAENGYQAICGILLEHKAFINAKSRVGLTALHLAAMKGFTRLCLFLIQEHGATVDALTLKKQTPLHLAAESGQLEVCRLLMGLRANADATDDKGQKPIHLAAQNNHAEVIKLFLKQSPALVHSFTKDGSTCAHLAAMQGSVAVLEELMKFDKQGVINARNRSTDATALQLAAEGGHAELVKTLLKAGASASDENRLGYTAAHLAAKNGHTNVLEALRNAQEDSINLISRKLGMSALHIAAFYGQTETVRELLQYIPATSATDPPLSVATSFIRELGTESGLTPLHMAAYSGEENVVRLLLNFEGVQVDAPTSNFGFNPLHLACRGGHITVVGLLLSRSAELLESKDGSGKASLHIAAVNGHKQMVEVLLGQGAEIDAIDKELWTPLICASKAGHLDVVKLLVESGASPLAKTAKGQSAIWFAAAENHVDVLSYLMKKDHDTYGLLEDKEFVYNLCVCGKNIDNEPIDEFVLSSPAPVDVAAKMSSFLVYVSSREKERAKDLIAASKHCEVMATELLALAAGAETAGRVLESVDRKGTEFLDVLIDCEQKEVIAHTVVQRHLQEIWVGHLDWADWKLLLLFFAFVFVPPVWITFSLPFGPKYHNIPIIKFMSYLTSHIHLMILLCLTCVTPIHPVYPIRSNLTPYWFEWMLFAWLGGLLVAEMTNPSDKSGLGWIKVTVLFFSYCGIGFHGMTFLVSKESYGTMLYLRDQLFGVGILLACVQILDFLSFHYLFGPWAIIIGNLMKDLARFLAVLAIFMVGFSLIMSSLNHPIHPRRAAIPGEKLPKALTNGLPSGVLVTPVDAFELLFFALFGLNNAGDMKIEVLGQPDWTIILFKIFFGIYLLVTVIVLINLLIAMMSDTYQRIEAQSDIEWKFGLAKLIRAMHRTTATPSPLNLFVDWGTWIYRQVKKAKRPKNKLKWEERDGESESGEGAQGSGTQAGTSQLSRMTPKQRWEYIVSKVSKKSRTQSGTDMHSFANLGTALTGSHDKIGSTLSTSAQNRIEMITDWHLIGKKYRVLVGKEEPVEESDHGDDQGSRKHGSSSSHMGSSMMI